MKRMNQPRRAMRNCVVMTLLAATTLAGCGRAVATSSEPFVVRREVAFRAVDEPFAPPSAKPMEFVAGVVQFAEGDQPARVLVTSRLIVGSPNSRPKRVEAALAYGDLSRNDWRDRGFGRALRLPALSKSLADTLRDTLVLELPLPAAARADLGQHWLALRLWGLVSSPGSSDWSEGFRSLHGSLGAVRDAGTVR